jgi:hypothetical protein
VRRPLGGRRLGPALAVLVALATAAGAACGGDDGTEPPAAAGGGGTGWVRAGGDLANTRAAPAETALGPDTVGDLRPAWELAGVLGVTRTPVDDGVVYVGDWTGHVRTLDAATGDEAWAPRPGEQLRRRIARGGRRPHLRRHVRRPDRRPRPETGEPAWETPIGDHPKAVVFGSPIVADGLVVAGVGSYEVLAPATRRRSGATSSPSMPPPGHRGRRRVRADGAVAGRGLILRVPGPRGRRVA